MWFVYQHFYYIEAETKWLPYSRRKFGHKGSINNIPALVQLMAWPRSGNMPLSEPMIIVCLTKGVTYSRGLAIVLHKYSGLSTRRFNQYRNLCDGDNTAVRLLLSPPWGQCTNNDIYDILNQDSWHYCGTELIWYFCHISRALSQYKGCLSQVWWFPC